MSKEPIPFWEKTYLDDSAITFSATPNATVTEFEHLLDKETSILEAGCGEGQNAIYLARQGFALADRPNHCRRISASAINAGRKARLPAQ